MPDQITPRYCGIKDLSKYTGIPVKTLYGWAGQGVIPSMKVRGRVLFDLHEIDQALKGHERENPESVHTIGKHVGRHLGL